jgi:SSS family solute:Na+ symporter
MVTGTAMAASQHFTAIYPLQIAGFDMRGYSAFYAFIANVIVAVVASVVLDAMGVSRGRDETVESDYVSDGVGALVSGVRDPGAAAPSLVRDGVRP